MSDFEAFADDIAIGMEYLEHHQILGAKWGVMNGPPYPLGSGDHSSSEKKAAAAAGVKVGSDSGQGSIDNVKKKKSDAQNKVKKAKKEMTPEERRQAALEAVRSGDKKKIAKYINELSTDELRDAQARAQMKDSLKKQDFSEQKASKADMEKMEAIRSGDKEKIKQYAEQMSVAELTEAMNKVDMMQKLNHVDPPPSAMDKLTAAMNNVEKFRSAAEKGIAAYNTAAKVYNATHKDSKWPIVGGNEKEKEKSQEQKVAESLVKQMAKDVKQNVQQVQQQKEEKTYKEKADEKLRNDKIDYKNQQKFEKWKEKQEAKNQPKEEKTEEQNKPQEKPKYDRKEGEGENARYYYDEAYNKARNSRLSDFDNVPSYDDLIPDDARDVMNRKVS